MDEKLKALVLQLPKIVKEHTKREYPNVKKELDFLQDYIQNTDWTKSALMDKVKEIEDMLSDKNEKKKQLKDHFRKFEVAMRLPEKAPTGGPESSSQKGNQRPAKRPTSDTKGQPGIPVLSGNVAPVFDQGVKKRSTRSETTQTSMEVSETNVQQMEEEYQDKPTDEVHFFEECIKRLKEMFKDDTEVNVEKVFQSPRKNIKEKVKTGHNNLIEVAREIRRLHFENKYLKKIMDDLRNNIIVGEAAPQKELKASKDIQDNKTIVELKTNSQEVVQKFHEMKTEAEYAAQLLEELNKLSKDGVKHETVIVLTEPPVRETRKKDNKSKPENANTPILRHVEQQQKNFVNASNVLKNHMELVYLYKRISQFLSTTVRNEGNEEQTQSDERLNKETGRKPRDTHASTKDPSEQSLNLDKELERVSLAWAKMKEKESASAKLKEECDCLLSILDSLHKEIQEIQYLTVGKTHNDEPSLLDQISQSIAKERPAYRCIGKAKEILNMQMECKREAEYAAQLIEELNQLSTIGVKEKTGICLTEPSKYVDSASSKAKPSSIHVEQLKKAFTSATNVLKKHMDKENNLRRAELLQSILDDLHEDVQALSNGEARNNSVSLFHQLENSVTNDSSIYQSLTKARAISSIQIEWKREAEYAACLLEELRQFSLASKKGDNKNILSDPSKEISWAVSQKEDKKVQGKSGDKPSQLVHNQKFMKHYGNASHVLNQMKEKEDLIIAFQNKTAELEALKKRLQSIQDENTKLANNADSLRKRLSEHAGAALTHENPSIADLSDPNRPTKLGEMYSELYDNQWTDAFGNLSKKYPSASEEKVISYLYDILVDGHKFCEVVREKQIWGLDDILFYPAGDMKSSQRRQKEEINKILAKNLSDAAKLSSNVASTNMLKAFLLDEKIKSKYKEILQPCETYIEGCIQLFWLMQVQTPPVSLDFKTAKGQVFQNNYREYTKKGKKIAFVVWPALFLHENGPLLVKGVAQGQ